MPRLIVEYASALAETYAGEDVTTALHAIMCASDLFQIKDVKTYAVAYTDSHVGAKGAHGTFVHATVAMLEGRTEAQEQALSRALFDCLRARLPMADSITVEIRRMIRATFCK